MTYPPGPPTHPSTPYGAIPPQPDGRRALTLVLSAVVVVLALVLAAGIVFVVKARDGDIYVPGLTLTAANDPGIDPFTDPVLVSGAGDLPANVALTGTAGAADLGGRAVNGTDAGLYAAGDTAACDTAALSNRLLADPPAARAWAGVYGIGTADIPHYLNTLTPVVLTTDTWVTNHSYTSGRAVPFQSVLQRGTAVYVDSAGVPRAMCSCGNPLAPPAAAPLGGYRLEGRTWEGYKSRSVTRIAYNNQNVTAVGKSTTIVPAPSVPAAPGTPVGDALQLLNFLTGQIFSQPLGGLLDLSRFPPPSGPLPTPAALNTPFEADTEEDAEHNGLIAPGDPAAAPALEERAAEHGGLPEGAPDSDSAAPDSAGPDSSESDSAVTPAAPGNPGPASDAPPPDESVPASDAPAPEAPGYEAPGPEAPEPGSEPGVPRRAGTGSPGRGPRDADLVQRFGGIHRQFQLRRRGAVGGLHDPRQLFGGYGRPLVHRRRDAVGRRFGPTAHLGVRVHHQHRGVDVDADGGRRIEDGDRPVGELDRRTARRPGSQPACAGPPDDGSAGAGPLHSCRAARRGSPGGDDHHDHHGELTPTRGSRGPLMPAVRPLM